MKALTIPAAVCEQIAQAGADTAGSVLMYIFGMRFMGSDPTPFVKKDSEAVRLIWSVVVKEYERIDKDAERKRTVRGQSAVTPSPSPKEKASPHTPYKEKDTSSSTPDIGQTRFDRFWSVYPRRVKKPDAKKKLLAILDKSKEPDKLLDMIIAAVKDQTIKLEWLKKENRTYIPHPTSWLNQRRWEDEVEAIGSENRREPRKADNWIGTPPEKIEEVF